MSTTTRVADKAGVLGTLVSAFACPVCFPAVASIGAAFGLGFLSQWEGVAVRVLVPAFALIALAANLAAWRAHRRWQRTALGVLGPVLALLGAFGLMGILWQVPGFLPANLARGLFYTGIALMIAVSIYDLARPASRVCRIDAASKSAGRS